MLHALGDPVFLKSLLQERIHLEVKHEILHSFRELLRELVLPGYAMCGRIATGTRGIRDGQLDCVSAYHLPT